MVRGQRRSVWTEERVQWLRENSYNRWSWEIQEDFKNVFGLEVTQRAINSALKRFNITTDVKKNRWRQLPYSFKQLTSPEQDGIIFEHFHLKGFGSYALLQKFVKERFNIDFSLSQCKGYCSRKHLTFGVNRHFKPGHIPSNKGKKMTDEQRLKAKSSGTWYEKGHKPLNWKPVGSTSFRGGFMMIKVAEPNKWRMASRVIWERETGEKLGRNDRVITLDGNPRNMAFENLCKVSASDVIIMRCEGLRSNIPDVTKVGITLAKLIKAKKEAEHGKTQVRK